MSIEQGLARLEVQLQADGRSPHTLEQYRRLVQRLGAWLEEQGLPTAVGSITHEHVAAFLASAAARQRPDGAPKLPSSINAMRSTLRSFFAFVHAAGYARQDAGRLIRRARGRSAPPATLSAEEQRRLLATLAKGKGPVARRDHLLFHLMLATGVRLGEALAIEAEDVDLVRREIRLARTKNGEPHQVLLGRAIAAHLKRDLRGRPKGFLFCGKGERPICPRQARHRLAVWLERAGIETHVSPHGLRHSFATDLYRRSGDLLLVGAALNHRSLAATAVYARIAPAKLRAAMR